MRKITLLLSFVVCAIFSQAQLLVNENFNYASGSGLIGQGGWAIVGTSTTNPITVSASTITYSGYPSSGIGQELSILTTGQDVTKAFTAQLTGTVYYSFIVNVQTAKSTYRGDYFIHLTETGSTSAFFARSFVKQVGAKISFGLLTATGGTYSPTYSDAIYDLNTTYLIVIKLNVATAASSLIINPTISNTEPSTNWVANTTGGTTVPSVTAGIGGINIRQGTDSIAPTLKLDGIRVATSWAGLFTTTALFTPKADVLEVNLKGNLLTVSNTSTSSVDVFNTLGSKVQTLKLVGGSAEINLPNGLYIARVGNQSAKIFLNN